MNFKRNTTWSTTSRWSERDGKMFKSFGGADAGMFYNRMWNMLRLTGRGLADSGESLDVRGLPDSLFMIVR